MFVSFKVVFEIQTNNFLNWELNLGPLLYQILLPLCKKESIILLCKEIKSYLSFILFYFRRPIFNWAHWGVGTLAYNLASKQGCTLQITAIMTSHDICSHVSPMTLTFIQTFCDIHDTLQSQADHTLFTVIFMIHYNPRQTTPCSQIGPGNGD